MADKLHDMLIKWLQEIGYAPVITSLHGGGTWAHIKICWGEVGPIEKDTEASLDVSGSEIILYTHGTHISLTASAYDKEAFGRLKGFLEAYAKMFKEGGNVRPGHFKI